jgi:hypothetical protein
MNVWMLLLELGRSRDQHEEIGCERGVVGGYVAETERP